MNQSFDNINYSESGVYYYVSPFFDQESDENETNNHLSNLINANPYNDDSLMYFINNDIMTIDFNGNNVYNNENYQEVWGRYYEDFSDNSAQGWSWTYCSCWNGNYNNGAGGCCAFGSEEAEINGSLNFSHCCSGGFRQITVTSPWFYAPENHEIIDINYNGGPSANGNGSWSYTKIQANTTSGWTEYNGTIPGGTTQIQIRFDVASTWACSVVLNSFEVLTSNFEYNCLFLFLIFLIRVFLGLM